MLATPRILFPVEEQRGRERTDSADTVDIMTSAPYGLGLTTGPTHAHAGEIGMGIIGVADDGSYVRRERSQPLAFSPAITSSPRRPSPQPSFKPEPLDFPAHTASPRPPVAARESTSSSAFSTKTPPSPLPADEKKQANNKMLTPSLALLFSLTTRQTFYTIMIPAMFFSIVAGVIPPYMTQLIGTVFGAFTTYSVIASDLSTTDAQLTAAKKELMKQVKLGSLEFMGLGLLLLATSVVGTALWTVAGERTAKTLRKMTYDAITTKGLAWFDLGAGAEAKEGEAGDGAGGLVGRFTKDTDDVRVGASLYIGMCAQYIISFVLCLALSFWHSWLLTFVILASIPLVMLLIGFTEKFAMPLGIVQRDFAAKSSARADRIIGAMTTVKSFNAEEKELEGFGLITRGARKAYNAQHMVWGIRAGVIQFTILSMFVQGFWFGSYLVRNGKASAASVNTCFWACLLSTTYVQSIVPALTIIEKGKIAMAGLLTLIRDDSTETPAAQPTTPKTPPSSPPPPRPKGSPFSFRRGQRSSRHRQRLSSDETIGLDQVVTLPSIPATYDEKDSKAYGMEDGDRFSPRPFQALSSPTSPTQPTFIPISPSNRRKELRPRTLKKIRPKKFTGELCLKDVTFHYPTRPHPAPPALQNVSLYLAAKETTYIVGTSGSGKSTVGSLLLGLYKAESGTIEVDEQGVEWIDDEWLRGHVACVSQGASVLFDGTVHDNVAIGVVGQVREDGTKRSIKDVTREEVEAACTGALIHDFIRDLPDGYDTVLSGEKGASLSGGQRQRLAIARAWVRDPTVLILDEATSALDATSRVLVNNAVAKWRKNKTTIIITHDLTPIQSLDFAYVLADGVVVEQGYREDLESNQGGPFWKMAHSGDVEDNESIEGVLEVVEQPERSPSRASERSESRSSWHGSSPFGVRSPPDLNSSGRELADARRESIDFAKAQKRKSSLGVPSLGGSPQQTRSRSISPSPSRGEPRPPHYDYSHFANAERRQSSSSFVALDNAAQHAMTRRAGSTRTKRSVLELDPAAAEAAAKKEWRMSMMVPLEKPEGDAPVVIEMPTPGRAARELSLFQVIRLVYPTIPNKVLFWLGIFFSAFVGACNPVFSSLLAKLMTNIASKDASISLVTSLLILLIAVLDGFGQFLKFYMLERCAMRWIADLRMKTLRLTLKQEKSWFDRPENSTTSLAHHIVKDTEDGRALIGTVIGNLCVVFIMLLMSLTWAFAVGWELTLVGLGLGPVFIVMTRLSSGVQAKHEAQNRVMRENLSKQFHQASRLSLSLLSSLDLSMSLESTFNEKFIASLEETYVGGRKAAPYSGVGMGTAGCMTYLAEALMFFVGGTLIADGRYTYAKMTEVFTLIIFGVTFSGQIMGYLPQMTKAHRALIDFWRLMELSAETRESEGRMTFPIEGKVTFDRVDFAYPQRPDAPVLKSVNFEIKPGEPSGSGKSTITSLLQRFYEPTSGQVLLDGRPLTRTDVRYLRDHIAVVSQYPTLFDMTISENIAYGCPSSITQEDIVRAAKAAQVHDFIDSLPKGYQTMLGDNASLISGGQAQRLQIARALIRPREILILDECTSALDVTNQQLVMETIGKVKKGKTTLIVTHKLAVMETCDRLLVCENGEIVEQGTFAELKNAGGLFSRLASGGEWEAS
ncbi:hypothetical protein MNV49_005604 [Pseudohyphozyma bogoriensis]|nr:hypothetical protein MNV49_005604 [Pseudohyphozyma bogoriensis]